MNNDNGAPDKDPIGEPTGLIDPNHKPGTPDVLPVLPLREAVLFPDMLLTHTVQDPRDIRLVDDVLLQDRFVAFVPVADARADLVADPNPIRDRGCVGVILKMIKFPDGGARLLVQGLKRIRIESILQRQPYFSARTSEQADVIEPGVALDALHRSVRDQFNALLELMPQAPSEVKLSAVNITDPGRFADLVAANLNLAMDERCSILDAADIRQRLERISVLLERELQIVELGTKIHEDVKQKINQGQREFFLREQLRAIRNELGDGDDRVEIAEIEKALGEACLPAEALKEAKRELSRLERMQAGSAEYTVARTYLDWMTALPWNRETDDRLDVIKARKILDADHYDLAKVKDRIIEFLAVRKIHPGGRSPILCFVGPPGVGKTSLGRSIAKAMNRGFERISLGGVRDEAEIRGHRRTYVGALPGRIVQGMRRAGTRNPVFMMDEVDKLVSDMHGDPSSALLEVLDPEQNSAFRDHYLDVPFDLSKVVFITTANTLETIPAALLDRMEVLQIAGYSQEEKLHIARKYLIPRVLADHGISPRKVKFASSALASVVASYTREAGLRNFERELAAVVRKIAVKIAGGKRGPFKIEGGDMKAFLGPPRFFTSETARRETPGVALGLAWTAAGGDVLYIEAAKMAGKKGLVLTGRLGDVIKESAQAALSWIRTRAKDLGLKESFFDEADIHIHFPEGATPKDGPSAGITLVAALVSLLTGVPVRPKLAMTGEITLRGKILPVGGVKEKALAARRAGVREVIIPKGNIHDLDELQPEVRRDIVFHSAETIGEMLPIAFPGLCAGLGIECGKSVTKTRGAGKAAKRRIPAKKSR